MNKNIFTKVICLVTAFIMSIPALPAYMANAAETYGNVYMQNISSTNGQTVLQAFWEKDGNLQAVFTALQTKDIVSITYIDSDEHATTVTGSAINVMNVSTLTVGNETIEAPAKNHKFITADFENTEYDSGFKILIDVSSGNGHEFSKEKGNSGNNNNIQKAAYTVEHYRQDEETYKLYETEELEGEVNQTVTATAKDYDEYTCDLSIEGTAASGEVNEDGSLVLKLYYRMNYSDEIGEDEEDPKTGTGTDEGAGGSNNGNGGQGNTNPENTNPAAGGSSSDDSDNSDPGTGDSSTGSSGQDNSSSGGEDSSNEDEHSGDEDDENSGNDDSVTGGTGTDLADGETNTDEGETGTNDGETNTNDDDTESNDRNGSGGGGITIEDSAVPLASLEKSDHFAYVIGYPEGDVRPLNRITREEVAMIFYRLLTDESRSSLLSDGNTFSDMAGHEWSNRAISTLSNAGIIKGYPDGTFKPSNSITRAEFATIAAKFDSLDLSSESMMTDIFGHWAEKFITSAEIKGWVKGYPDSTFKPEQLITRAEAMTLINNVLGRKVPKENIYPEAMFWQDITEEDWYFENVMEATNSHDYLYEEDGDELWTGMKANKVWP
ncbi:MAG: S-layer homology domain-containing protein [Sedimentibacter sp.]|uniref:S-layer homology domain-containing protein n=1 Tax=Sedimentibacter sp. TaxID=1960295 RepID=UPI0031589C5A